MRKYLPILLLGFLISCHPKTVAEDGGLIIDISLQPNANITLVDSTVTILKNRISLFCTNPTVTLIADKKNIQIKLPGVSDSSFFKKNIFKKGDFKIVETYELKEIFPNLAEINNILAENNNLGYNIPTDSFTISSPLFGILQVKTTMEGLLQEGPEIGYAYLKDTALISTILRDDTFYYKLPQNIDFKWAKKKDNSYVALLALKKPRHEAPITSQMISDAQAVKGNTDEYVVDFTLKEYYFSDWAYLTRKNIGKSLAIVIDNELYAYPRVSSEIKEGKSQISTSMTKDQAKALSAILKYGVIPINFEVTKITLVPKP